MVDLVDYEASFCPDATDVHTEKTSKNASQLVSMCYHIQVWFHPLPHQKTLFSQPPWSALPLSIIFESVALLCWQVAASYRRANVEKQRLYPETNTIKTLTLLYGLHIETHKKKKQHIPVWGELQKRTIPSAKSSMLNAEFHSQCRLARVSLSLCNNIFEINISFQSSGQQDMSLLDFRLR